jgi:hypothetical protein
MATCDMYGIPERYQCTDLRRVLGQVVLACVMCGRRRFVIACMLRVLILMMIVWILVTPCFPL